MKSIFFSALLFISSNVLADSTLEDLANAISKAPGPTGLVFNFTIETSFHGSFLFKMFRLHGEYYLESSYSSTTCESEERCKTNSEDLKHELAQEDVEQLYLRLESALQYNVLDSVSGFDGSHWCLEAHRGGTYTKGCFWSPSINSEERGLEALFQFGEYLVGRANFGDYELY